MSEHVIGSVTVPDTERVKLMVKEGIAGLDGSLFDEDAKKAFKDDISTDIKAAKDAAIAEANKVDEVAQANKTDIIELNANLRAEAEAREKFDDGIKGDLAAEAEARKVADTQLTGDLATEVNERKEADIELGKRIDDLDVDGVRASVMEQFKVATEYPFEDSIKGVKIAALPIAQITVENKDRTISVGDTLGTVSKKFIPKTVIDFAFVTVVEGEGGKDAYAYLACRLEETGNIRVVNKTMLGEDLKFEGNINSITFMYITEE